MQRLSYVILQLDEAKRYLEGGSLAHLRLALLLLDNAAELQMYRRVHDDFSFDEILVRVRDQALRGVAPEGARHGDQKDGDGQGRADPEASRHAAQLRALFLLGNGRHRFQCHAADRAAPGLVCDDLRVHGTGVSGSR